MAVTIRYWAAAKEAAGVGEEAYDAATLEELLAAVLGSRALSGRARPDDGRLARVLARCAFLVDGDPVGLRAHASVHLGPGVVVEALPPFAGG